MEHFDVIVVGAGPAGTVAAAEAQAAGLHTALLDRGTLGEGISKWPHQMRFFSTVDKIELPGLALVCANDKPSREEYLAYLRRYARERVADFRPFRTVHCINRIDPDASASSGKSCFRVSGVDRWETAFRLHADNVVLATGAFDEPNMLGVPGESLPHVSHFFDEVHRYAMHRVVIVGGGSSAVETALLLWRAGAQVTIVHRGPAFRAVKFWLAPDIQNRVANGEITAHFNSRVRAISEEHVFIETPGGPVRLEADYVLALTGYRPSTMLLESAGADFDPETRRPKVDPDTLETSVPGLYVAGVAIAGNMSGDIFIENSRDHGSRIVAAIQRRAATR